MTYKKMTDLELLSQASKKPGNPLIAAEIKRRQAASKVTRIERYRGERQEKK